MWQTGLWTSSDWWKGQLAIYVRADTLHRMLVVFWEFGASFCQYWIWIYGLLFSAKLPPALQGCLITSDHKTTIWWLCWTRLYFRKFHHLRLCSFEYYNSARYMHTNICSWSISYSSSSAWFRLWMWFSKVLTLPAIYCTTYFPHRMVEWYSRWSPGSRIHYYSENEL